MPSAVTRLHSAINTYHAIQRHKRIPATGLYNAITAHRTTVPQQCTVQCSVETSQHLPHCTVSFHLSMKCHNPEHNSLPWGHSERPIYDTRFTVVVFHLFSSECCRQPLTDQNLPTPRNTCINFHSCTVHLDSIKVYYLSNRCITRLL